MGILGDIAWDSGVGAVIGFSMGYAIKKAIKILLFFVGSIIAFLYYLSYKGFITFRSEEFLRWVSEKLLQFESGLHGIASEAVSSIPLASGFILGFALGLKKG